MRHGTRDAYACLTKEFEVPRVVLAYSRRRKYPAIADGSPNAHGTAMVTATFETNGALTELFYRCRGLLCNDTGAISLAVPFDANDIVFSRGL